ncbi:fungal-specific transcription factor domain-containing protein [Trichoderma ceciliae]
MAIADKDTAEMAILASIFLCKYEIIKDGVENWRFHLRGIESLCQSLDAEQTASMSNTLTYVRSFMSYHKNIARITEYSSQAREDDFEREPFEMGKLFPVDPYMGFSRSLIVLLGQVNDLLVINIRDEPHRLRQEVEAILSLLARRSWIADRFAIPKGMGATTIAHSSHIAEAYRCAIIACIHAVLEAVAKREDAAVSPMGPMGLESQWQSSDWASLHALLPVVKAEALTDCLAAVSRVPLGCPEEAGLLPLLFIVACETSRQDQAREVLQRVEALGSHIGLGNVRCASVLLKKVWHMRSTQRDFYDWRGLLAKFKWDLIIT